MQEVVKEWNLGRMLGFLTKQYIGLLTKRLESTPVERYYYPLYIIGKHSGEICQQTLADKLLIDKVSLVRILNALTDDGFVERVVNPDDRREHILHITKKGQPWVEEIENGLKETDDVILNFLPISERKKFKNNLLILIAATRDLPLEQVELFYNRTKDFKHE